MKNRVRKIGAAVVIGFRNIRTQATSLPPPSRDNIQSAESQSVCYIIVLGNHAGNADR